MVLEILEYPDKRLFERSVEVDKFDTELGEFLDNMYDTMIFICVIGLAAIHVGRPIRALIITVVYENEI